MGRTATDRGNQPTIGGTATVRAVGAPVLRGSAIVGSCSLPIEPPLEPMLAKPSNGLPEGDGWLFEPKWDGFRAIVFRDGDELLHPVADLKPLDRYFPELAAPLLASTPGPRASSTARS